MEHTKAYQEFKKNGNTIVLGVSVDFIMYGEKEEKSELLSEAMDVLSDMDELQIRQCLAMMKAMKSVSVEK